MNKQHLTGKKYINLLRCSDDDQVVSIPDQRTSLSVFADQYGLTHASVPDQEAKGVSGSNAFCRKDIDELIEKKQNGGDFEIILLHDLSRLTRAGISHGHKLKHRLARAGLKLVSVGDNLPEGDEGELVESVLHFKNKMYAKGLSLASTRGMYSAVESGRQPTTSTTPFGFDRLYMLPDGAPTLLVRDIGGGVKHRLDPVTYDIRAISMKDRDGKSVKFKKQTGEISKLVLGVPERVELVRWMFREHYVNGVGIPRITNALNHQSVKPLQANVWSTHTVHRMLRNPIYLGKPIAFQVSKGFYNKASAGKPTAIEVDQAVLEERGLESMPATKRPQEEWLYQKPRDGDEHVRLIVDPEVYQIAEKVIDSHWAKWADGTLSDQANHDRHSRSTYFLKRALRTKQGDHPMHGRTSGRPRRIRYYRIRHIEAQAPKYSVLRRLIPADPVETAVLGVLVETMKSAPEVGRLVEEHVQLELASIKNHPSKRQELEKEEEKLSRRLKLIYSTSGNDDADDRDLKDMILNLKSRQRDIRKELSLMDKFAGKGAIDPAAISSSVMTQFKELSRNLIGLPVKQLQRLVEGLCQNFKVDLETRELTFDVKLPAWAMSNAPAIMAAVGVEVPPALPKSFDTHVTSDLKLASYKCEHHRANRKSPICYECTRKSLSKAA